MDTGMVFAIIFTLIVVGFILAVGVGQIQSFFCLGSNAQTNKAVNDIETLTEELFVLAKGSSKNYPISLPADAKVCFINITNPSAHPYTDSSKTWNPSRIILESVLRNPSSSSYGSNVWIYRCGDAVGSGYKMDYLSPSKSFCATGGDKLYLENRGKSVDISFLE